MRSPIAARYDFDVDPLIDRYRRLARTLHSILAEVEAEIRPGRTTRELEQIAEDAIHRAGVQSCFVGYRGFPMNITASVNDEVLNTLPSKRVLKDGDLLKLQVGIQDGVGFSYQAWTYFVGPPSKDDARFVETGRIALSRGVGAARAGDRVSRISAAIQQTIEGAGYSVNKKYVGHGMGSQQHENPQVPGYVIPGAEAPALPLGQILSVLVVAHQGRDDCRTAADGWNVVTRDRSQALLLSQIVVVRAGLPEIILEPRTFHPSTRA